MLLSKKFDEKREYFRMRIDSEFTYHIPDKNRTLSGVCKNLSHTGIQFETTYALTEGQSIEATLDSKDSRFKPLNARVNVIRIEKTDNNLYRVAGEIIEYK